jgi:hypothetical protein
MPIPGAAIYHQLQDALDQNRSAVASQKRNVDLLDEQLNDLVARKGAALLELARYYLPDFSRSSVETTFAEVRSTLLEVLGRKERTRAELTARAGRSIESVRTLDENLDLINTQLNEQERRREELEIQVSERLKEDVDFQRLSREAAQMEARLQQNEARPRIAVVRKRKTAPIPTKLIVSVPLSARFCHVRLQDHGDDQVTR